MSLEKLFKEESNFGSRYEISGVKEDGGVVLRFKWPRKTPQMSFADVETGKRDTRDDDVEQQPARPPPLLEFDSSDEDDDDEPIMPQPPAPELVAVDDDTTSSQNDFVEPYVTPPTPPTPLPNAQPEDSSGESASLFGGADSTDDDGGEQIESIEETQVVEDDDDEDDEDGQGNENAGTGLASQLVPMARFETFALESANVRENFLDALLNEKLESANARLLQFVARLQSASRTAQAAIRFTLQLMASRVEARGYAVLRGIYADYECEMDMRSLRIADRRSDVFGVEQEGNWSASQNRVAFECTVLRDLDPDDDEDIPPFVQLDGTMRERLRPGDTLTLQSAFIYSQVFDTRVRDMDGLESEEILDAGLLALLNEDQIELIKKVENTENRFYASHSESDVLAVAQFGRQE